VRVITCRLYVLLTCTVYLSGNLFVLLKIGHRRSCGNRISPEMVGCGGLQPSEFASPAV